jgi:hypothetical protein
LLRWHEQEDVVKPPVVVVHGLVVGGLERVRTVGLTWPARIKVFVSSNSSTQTQATHLFRLKSSTPRIPRRPLGSGPINPKVANGSNAVLPARRLGTASMRTCID